MRQTAQKNWLAVLVDDDIHSARMLLRTFAEFEPGSPKWLGGASRGLRLLQTRFKAERGNWPALVIVDLKSTSTSTADFIAAIRLMAQACGTMIVAVAPSIDKPVRDALHAAGATAVFQRRDELDLYRQEVANIISFWVRNQHLDAVGT